MGLITIISVALVVGLGIANADAYTARFALGAAVAGLGVLIYRLHTDSKRQTQQIQTLENQLDALTSAQRSKTKDTEPSPSKSTAPPPKAATSSSPSAHVDWPAPQPSSSSRDAKPAPPKHPSPAPSKPELSSVVRALAWLRNWLVSGNVPVKVGVLISFFGVSFLLKYAAEHNYLTLPAEGRLIGVGLAALGALYFGWRQRTLRPSFALSLQGGALGVLFLTVFAAFQSYALLSATFAFALLLVLTLAAGALAVAQNAMALAALGVVGGFLAPVLISTGSGNPVALFSYYALLNCVVFGLAWYRPWRILNLIGFVFTFLVGTAWGYEYYQPEYFGSVEPFLILFFLMYLGISMAYALGRSIQLRSYLDSSLVFGLPLLTFPLQKQLVEHFEFGTAISATGLAVVYLVAATVLLRSKLRARVRLLVEAFIALGIGFATLAVPLALSAHWTALTWALEGAAMVWLGSRQARKLPSAAGAVLQFAAGLAFLYGLLDLERRGDWLFFNDRVLGGVILAVAGLASARWLERNGGWFKGAASLVAWALFAWGLLWWFTTLSVDIARVVENTWAQSGWLLLWAGTAAAMLLVQKYLAWDKVQLLLSAYLPVLLLSALSWLERTDASHYLAFGGWLAWPLALLTLIGVFKSKQGLFDKTLFWQRAMSVWLLGFLILEQLHWAVGSMLTAEIWALAAVLCAAATMHLVVWILWQTRRLGVDLNNKDWSVGGIGPVLGVAALGMLALLTNSPADPAPLPYFPFFNPLFVASAVLAIAIAHWARLNQVDGQERARLVWFGLAGFALLLVTGEVTRTVHHWAGIPFQAEALFASVRVQASLSVVWALSALATMVYGHRRAERTVYLCGAALMAVVVAKLFLVDLAQSGTLERIVSFIGVGLLLLVVGFLAPVPPKDAKKTYQASPS